MIRSFSKSECFMIPYLKARCRFDHNCRACDIADRVRNNARELTRRTGEVFIHCDTLAKTDKGGGKEFLYKPLILKPEAMQRAGISVELFNQIFVATDGAGMLSSFPGSQIDGYLLADPRKLLTFGRQDFYGIPNEYAVRRFKNLFLIDLSKISGKGVVRMI